MQNSDTAPPDTQDRPARGRERSLLDMPHLRDDTAMPMYQQLERQLTALIEDGSIAPGTTLPAERQLAERLEQEAARAEARAEATDPKED